jgi:hypothetical protein
MGVFDRADASEDRGHRRGQTTEVSCDLRSEPRCVATALSGYGCP